MQVVFFLVTYVVPMVGLSVTYSHLGSVLWAAHQTRLAIARFTFHNIVIIVIIVIIGNCYSHSDHHRLWEET